MKKFKYTRYVEDLEIQSVRHHIPYVQGSPVMRATESPFKRRSVLAWKCCYIFLHLSSPNLIENDHNLVFFGYKVSTQQHFKSRLFWKTAKHALSGDAWFYLDKYSKPKKFVLKKSSKFGENIEVKYRKFNTL